MFFFPTLPLLPSEITGVSPSYGGTEGGTRITVTVDVSLTNYTDTDVKIFVGGKEMLIKAIDSSFALPV